MAQQKYKLNIFDTLKSLSTKDRGFFQRLNDEEKKAYQPLIIMRWLSGTKNARQILFLNELVNPLVFNLTQHKELLNDLMISSASGRSQRYVWNKNNAIKQAGMTNTISVVRRYFGFNSKQAREALPILTTSDIIKMCDDLGLQKDELKLVQKELKNNKILKQ